MREEPRAQIIVIGWPPSKGLKSSKPAGTSAARLSACIKHQILCSNFKDQNKISQIGQKCTTSLQEGCLCRSWFRDAESCSGCASPCPSLISSQPSANVPFRVLNCMYQRARQEGQLHLTHSLRTQQPFAGCLPPQILNLRGVARGSISRQILQRCGHPGTCSSTGT